MVKVMDLEGEIILDYYTHKCLYKRDAEGAYRQKAEASVMVAGETEV